MRFRFGIDQIRQNGFKQHFRFPFGVADAGQDLCGHGRFFALDSYKSAAQVQLLFVTVWQFSHGAGQENDVVGLTIVPALAGIALFEGDVVEFDQTLLSRFL